MRETQVEHTPEEQEHLKRLQAEVERLEAEEAEHKRQWEAAQLNIQKKMQGPPGNDASVKKETPPPPDSPGPIERKPELKGLDIDTRGIERKG
jgi:hypothetical protein